MRRALVDAPVSGGVVGAEQGRLVIMAGGEPADIERLRARWRRSASG